MKILRVECLAFLEIGGWVERKLSKSRFLRQYEYECFPLIKYILVNRNFGRSFRLINYMKKVHVFNLILIKNNGFD